MSHPSTTLQAGENEGDSVPRWAEVAGHTCGSTTTRSISSRTWRSVASTEQRSLSTRARSWLAICLRSCTVPSGAFSRRIGWPSKRPASASRSAGILARMRPLASSARTAASRSPTINASSIARLDTLSTATRPTTFFDDRLAVAGQVAQLTDGTGRHEAGAHQAVLDQLADPHRIGHVGLAPGRHVVQMRGVQQPAVEVVFPTDSRRAAVHAGRLHPDQRHPVGGQPQTKPLQLRRGRSGSAHLPRPAAVAVGRAHTRRPCRGGHPAPRSVQSSVASAASFGPVSVTCTGPAGGA